MKSIDQLIAETPNASDADIATAYNAQPAEPRVAKGHDTYVTYLSIGQMPAPFNGNTAGAMRTTLLAWCAGPDLSAINTALPNPGQLRALHDRLAGYPGVDLSSPTAPALLQLFAAGVPAANLSPILTADQASALLAVGYLVADPTTAEAVASVRAGIALTAAKNATLVALQQWASYVRDTVDAATSAGQLPTVPEVPA